MFQAHVVPQVMSRRERLLAERTGGEAPMEIHVVQQALAPVEALAAYGACGNRRRWHGPLSTNT